MGINIETPSKALSKLALLAALTGMGNAATSAFGFDKTEPRRRVASHKFKQKSPGKPAGNKLARKADEGRMGQRPGTAFGRTLKHHFDSTHPRQREIVKLHQKLQKQSDRNKHLIREGKTATLQTYQRLLPEPSARPSARPVKMSSEMGKTENLDKLM